MIAKLRGTVSSIEQSDLVLDVSGVGYLICVTSTVSAQAAHPPDGEFSLFVYTEVREDDISLFGFSSHLEKQVFLLLKKVRGIGSRTAISIISVLGAEAVLGGIGKQDLDALQRVPGVGKKTAERIIVELREQVNSLIGRSQGASAKEMSMQIEVLRGAQGVEKQDPAHDAVLALERLGFSADRAQQAIALVAREHADEKNAGRILQLALTKIGS